MRKKFSIIILAALIVLFTIPFKVQAAELDVSKCTKEDLVTTFNAIKITNYDLTQYNKKNDKRINIYVFRGDGCRNCENFYQYYVANKLLASHGDKIRIISYEVKNNPFNFRLLDEAQTLLNQQSSAYSTPTIFIGNKTFSGDLVVNNNAQQKQAEMETAINNLYNSNNRYDIIEELTCKNVFSDNVENVTLTSAKKLDKNYVLKAKKVNYQNLKLEEPYNYIVAYDISMYNGNVVVPLSNGSYKIRIPVTTTYQNYEVGYIKDGKIQEKFKTTYDSGFVEFTTTHLSEYIVYGTNSPKPETKPETKPEEKPETKPEVKPETKPEAKPEEKPETKPEVKPEEKPIVNTNQDKTTNTIQKEQTSGKVQNPKTFDGIQMHIVLLGLACSSLIGSLLLFKKKEINLKKMS